MGTRLTIDSLTCLLANEHDPSRLLASSPGKLVRYLVVDGAHLANDQPYAEVEVSTSFYVATCTAITSAVGKGLPPASACMLLSKDMVAESKAGPQGSATWPGSVCCAVGMRRLCGLCSWVVQLLLWMHMSLQVLTAVAYPSSNTECAARSR